MSLENLQGEKGAELALRMKNSWQENGNLDLDGAGEDFPQQDGHPFLIKHQILERKKEQNFIRPPWRKA